MAITETAEVTVTNIASVTTTNIETFFGNNQAMALAVIPDADGDGQNNAVDPDDDNDRMIDAHEIIANTDPFDDSSFLWLMIERSALGDSRDLRFPTSTGRTYRIQSTTNFIDSGSWVDEMTGIPGTGGFLFFPRTNFSDHLYYRIGVESP